MQGKPCTNLAATGAPPPIGWLWIARLFVPFSLGYFLSYFFRTINAVIAPSLAAEFNLTPASIGLLTSSYLLTFALMQIPVGLMVDRFGVRRVQACLLLFAALGAAGFAFARTLAELTLARGLIGVGVAGCLMVAFSAFVLWLPARSVPAMSGFLMAFGGLGAFAAGAPAEAVIAATGSWRPLFFGMAGAAIALSAIVFVTVPDRTAPRKASLLELLTGLGRVYTNRRFWDVAPLAITACGSAFALQGLWVGPWLMQVAGRRSQDVGVQLSAMGVALIAGSAACGPIAALAARMGLTLLQAVAAMGLIFILALSGLVLQWTSWSFSLWVTLAFLTNPLSMSYLALSQSFEGDMAARVNTGMNALVLTGSFFFQWAVGRTIEFWEPVSAGVYPARAFQVSFALVLCCVVLAWMWNMRSLVLKRRSDKAVRAPSKPQEH